MNNFKETQLFRVWWIWTFVSAVAFLFSYAYIRQEILNRPLGGVPAPALVLLVIAILFILVIVLLLLLRLKTKVDETGIHYMFFPLQVKYTTIVWHEVSDAYLRDYEPLFEFAGWGIRGDFSNKAYTMSGKKGLQLVLSKGNRVLIGTRKAAALKSISAKYFRP